MKPGPAWRVPGGHIGVRGSWAVLSSEATRLLFFRGNYLTSCGFGWKSVNRRDPYTGARFVGTLNWASAAGPPFPARWEHIIRFCTNYVKS
jgi:hypothetical protein